MAKAQGNAEKNQFRGLQEQSFNLRERENKLCFGTVLPSQGSGVQLIFSLNSFFANGYFKLPEQGPLGLRRSKIAHCLRV